MKFNERLRATRKRFKVTQKTLAEHLGVTLRTYQRYEEGSIEPPASTICSISNFFNLPTDCLLGNGLFSNWEEILSHKNTLFEALESEVLIDLPVPLNTLDEPTLAKALPAIIERIDINPDTGDMKVIMFTYE